MSKESQSMDGRVSKFARSFKQKIASSFLPPSSSLINVKSGSDNHMASSNLPLDVVPVGGVDHAAATSMKRHRTSPDPISEPVSASIRAVPSQLGSVSSPAPETPPAHMSPDPHGPMSFLQGAQNVYMSQPTITMANNVKCPSNSVQYVPRTDGIEKTRPQILAALRDHLLPRAEFAEYDAASPAPRNACTENTHKEILDRLRAWASDDTTANVFWLSGMAGTGKTTIAYSFSELLDEKNSLGGSFFASHLRVDTSNVRCIIPTISLQLAASGYLPSLSQLILDVVEANPDCKSWRISKQFLNFIVTPLTAACEDTRGGVIPVIVLDALDECSDQSLMAELLSEILKHSKSLPVKFFITSHPEIVVKETSGHSGFILHEIIKADDDELYIKAQFGGQIKHNRHHWPQADLKSLVNIAPSAQNELHGIPSMAMADMITPLLGPSPKYPVRITLKNLADFNIQYSYAEDGIKKEGILMDNQISDTPTLFFMNTPYLFLLRQEQRIESVQRMFTRDEDWDLAMYF